MGFFKGDGLMISPKSRQESFENCTSSLSLTRAQSLKNKMAKSISNTHRYRLIRRPRLFECRQYEIKMEGFLKSVDQE
jgi:hypothetical protein